MERLEKLDEKGFEIYQDDNLYCFTSDSILLSEFAVVKNNDVVADFCSGSGVVGFNLYRLNPSIKSLTFFELQKPLYDLSVKTIEKNNLADKMTAVNVRIQDIPKEYNETFSLIVVNPPYMKKGAGESDKTLEIGICRRELELTLEELALSLSKALKFGGRVCAVYPADRLAEVIFEFKKNNIEPKRIQTVSAFNKEPYLFLIEGVKGGKCGVKVLQNLNN